jgi:DNA-binding NarL/FixJ family response regulator
MKQTCVVVEDKEGLRQLLSDWLQSSFPGIEFFNTSTGEEAVQLALLNKPTVMVMDVSLPGINGITATRLIKRLLPQTKIIIHTIHDEKAYHADADSAGADGYITKSKTQADLIPLLQRIFEDGSINEDANLEISSNTHALTEKSISYSVINIQTIIDELWQALELLDGPRSQNAINLVSEIDPEIGKRLQGMLENLEYHELLSILDKMRRKGALC